MIRTVEAALPILGRVQLELEPRAAGVALRASTTLLRAPEAVLTADECMTLARELLRAAARSLYLAGKLAPHELQGVAAERPDAGGD